MTETSRDKTPVLPSVRIGDVSKEHQMLALGCWAFGGVQWGKQDDADSRATMRAALRSGLNHFDTASGYGSGRSERLVGEFLAQDDCRDTVFVATKGNTPNATGEEILAGLDQSLADLALDSVDLFYLHWPRAGMDMRPVLAAMEQARAQGKIRAVGVSNFSVAQLEQVKDVAHVDANQICYNLFWRFPEAELLPYCAANDIAVVTYSSTAQGILTGKFPRNPEFPEGDGRAKMVLFDDAVWPHLYEAVEQLKGLAAETGRPLGHLAIRWLARQTGVRSILVGARNTAQAEENAGAIHGAIEDAVFDRMTAVSDEAVRHVPDTGNIFRYYP